LPASKQIEYLTTSGKQRPASPKIAFNVLNINLSVRDVGDHGADTIGDAPARQSSRAGKSAQR
jgi:hypothetical protein